VAGDGSERGWFKNNGGGLAVVGLLGVGWYGWTSRPTAKIGRDEALCLALAKEAALKRLRTPAAAKFGGLDAQLNMMNATVTGYVDSQEGSAGLTRRTFTVVFDGPSGGRRVESVRFEKSVRLETN
jgi:hypothetical protein